VRRGVSEDTIGEMLSSEEAQEKASKLETLEAIQRGCGEAFGGQAEAAPDLA
jgi:hypothetical protein